jgi:hypothetical protein
MRPQMEVIHFANMASALASILRMGTFTFILGTGYYWVPG